MMTSLENFAVCFTSPLRGIGGDAAYFFNPTGFESGELAPALFSLEVSLKMGSAAQVRSSRNRTRKSAQVPYELWEQRTMR